MNLSLHLHNGKRLGFLYVIVVLSIFVLANGLISCGEAESEIPSTVDLSKYVVEAIE